MNKESLDIRRLRRREYYEKKKQEFLEARARGAKPKSKDFHEANPWLSSYACAKKRCECPSQINYKFYGGRGIKFNLTLEEVKDLYLRDEAYNMKQPSLDREDPNKDYVYENCRFIELVENCSRANLGKKRRKTEE